MRWLILLPLLLFPVTAQAQWQGYEVVMASDSIEPGDEFASVRVYCPLGKIAINGGWAVGTPSGAYVLQNRPEPFVPSRPSAWNVAIRLTEPAVAGVRVDAFAVCVNQQQTGGVRSNSKLYVATGTNPSGVGERFAGGAACCNCQIEHLGKLPEDFPTGYVRSVTFFLTGSRADSYYTRVREGPTRLKLELGNDAAAAESVRLPADSNDPVPHTWTLTFHFEPAVKASPGMRWRLRDGDAQIYSAVLLHASSQGTVSDVANALPGQARVANCQYARTDAMWYSVAFEFR